MQNLYSTVAVASPMWLEESNISDKAILIWTWTLSYVSRTLTSRSWIRILIINHSIDIRLMQDATGSRIVTDHCLVFPSVITMHNDALSDVF
jgi:hypothetical protein